MSGSVKDLIRSIRGSKTVSEEKAVLAKECAKIRSSLTSDNIASRRKNITKLLFIHLLGHPTNFGQVECIKLIASSKFSDKRIGYLALNVLLTEDSEVLMLATNSIKIDLNDPNPYVCEMALRSLANIGTDEMLRELQYEVERLMNSNVPNIKKKATICTVRMLRKEANRNLTPDSVSMELARSFLKYLGPLISDYDNGVKTAGLSLMAVLLEHYTELCNLPEFFQLLLNTLSNLLNPLNTNYNPSIPTSTSEPYNTQNLFDDHSSNDPFLKVKLLSLIKQVYHKLLSNKSQGGFDSLDNSRNRDLLADSKDFDMNFVGYKQQLYDMVSMMISTIEMGTNSNYSILYECLTAIECELSDEKFNELGKMVVDKFIQGPTNNIKYLALGVIKKLHNLQVKQGDSIWSIILQSFKQRDLSIRMKALDVSLKVVNGNTLKPLMQYLYEFLLSADEDLRKESLHRIFNCVNQHSDDLEYKLQVFVKIFTIAGNSVQDVILFDFIDLLASSNKELKVNTTLELLKVVKYNMGQSALVKSTLYSVGEYYDLLSNVKLKKVLSTHSPVNSGTKNNNVDSDQLNNTNDINGTNDENKTSIDLLLDLSTPTNRTSSRPNLQNEDFDKPREDDLLLDLEPPCNAATGAGGPDCSYDNDLLDLYNFDNNQKYQNDRIPRASNYSYNNANGIDDFNLDHLESLGSQNNIQDKDDNSNTTNTNDDYYNYNKDIYNKNKNKDNINKYEDNFENFGDKDLDDDLAVVELIENICVRLLTKNLLNECEFLITCIGKLVYKMPKGSENLRKILRKFKRHSNPELQQRACELDILIQENMVSVIDPANKGVVHRFSSSDKNLSSLYTDTDNELASLYNEKLVVSRRDDMYDNSNTTNTNDYHYNYNKDNNNKNKSNATSRDNERESYSSNESRKGSGNNLGDRGQNDDFFNFGDSTDTYKQGEDRVRQGQMNTDEIYKKGEGRTEDLFDEFFNTNNKDGGNVVDNFDYYQSYQNSSNYQNYGSMENNHNRQLKDVDLVKDLDFNTDKLTNNIVENVAVVSSRDKKEDDFQQFDPF